MKRFTFNVQGTTFMQGTIGKMNDVSAMKLIPPNDN